MLDMNSTLCFSEIKRGTLLFPKKKLTQIYRCQHSPHYIQDLERQVHGRGRKEGMDEMYFGVYDQLLYARKTEPVEGTNYLLQVVLILQQPPASI